MLAPYAWIVEVSSQRLLAVGGEAELGGQVDIGGQCK